VLKNNPYYSFNISSVNSIATTKASSIARIV